MKLNVLSVKEKSFTGDNGESIPYFWYRVEISPDGVPRRVQAGCKRGDIKLGPQELDAFQEEGSDGKLRWKIE